MNPMNFDWINNNNNNNSETNDDGNVSQSLGLDLSDLGDGDGQDFVKYLFDSTQFSTPLDSSSATLATSPTSISSNSLNYTASSPESTTLTTLSNNNSNISAMPTLDQTWLMTMDPQLPFPIASSQPTPPITKAATSTSSSSRKMRIKKNQEPIFVTEKPQNAYKKRIRRPPTAATAPPSSLQPIDEKQQQQQQDSSCSPPSPFEDDDDMDVHDPSDKRHMSSKEKRQLRNKISARNFRVRRKEYINQLENLVDQQEDEITLLKKENNRLTKLNQQMIQELFQLKQQPSIISQPQPLQQPQLQQYHLPQPLMTVSSSSSESNSPPDIMDTLLDFGLFTNNTYLSHAITPDFDLSHVLGGKLKNPPSSTQLEDHRELMTMYPLLAPTLASMVLRHTFILHYTAYLSNSYNALRPKNEPLDIMHLDDWVSAVSSASIQQQGGGDDGDPNRNNKSLPLSPHVVERTESSSHTNNTDSNDDDDNDSWTTEFERSILQQHYPYYAFMRLRGLSHDDVIRRCQASMQRRLATERQRRRKAASCSKWQALHGFSAVATTLLRNPSRSPMIASVIQDTKACQVSQRKIKVPLMVSAPMRALRIAGGKA